MSTSSGSYGANYYVRKTGDDANSGTDPGTAWLTVDKAADSVSAGDTVYVGAGTYSEPINPLVSGTAGNRIQFLADLDGAQTGDAGKVFLTTASGRILDLSYGGPHDYLTFRGFVFANCSSFAIYGVHCVGITLEDCEVIQAGSHGLRFEYGEIRIANCSFHDNGSSGIFLRYTVSAEITDSRFHSNQVYGMYAYDTQEATASRCQFLGNLGNGVHCQGSTLDLTSCLLQGNASDGIQIASSSSNDVSIINCTVVENKRNGIFCSGGTLQVANSVVVNQGSDGLKCPDSTTHSHNLVYGNGGQNFSGGASQAASEIVADPEFVSTTNFHLRLYSPAVDAGKDMSGVVTTDLEKRSLPYNAVWDMGCYEHGPLGHWKLDESSGTLASDASGTGNDGKYTNSPKLGVAGIYHTAAQFSGSNYVVVEDNANLNMDNTMTMAAWIKPMSSGAIQHILNKEGEYECAVFPGGSLQWAFANSKPGWAWHNTGSIVPSDQWSHIVIGYDSGEVTTYVNGQVVDVYNGTGTIGDTVTSKNTFQIGAREAYSNLRFIGPIDDVRIYSQALLPKEVAALYGMIAHWKLDETSGSVAVDSSPAKNDAIYVGSPTLGVNGSSVAKNGTAVEFNGTSQYVRTDRGLLNSLSAFSMTGWYRPVDTIPNISFLGQHGLIELGIGTASNRLDLWTLNGGSVSAAVQLPVSKWSHIAVVGDGTSLKLYLNGVEVASGGSFTGNYGSNSNVFKLGEGVLSPFGDYFEGRVDDVRLFSRKISPEEIQSLYQGGRPNGVRIIRWIEVR